MIVKFSKIKNIAAKVFLWPTVDENDFSKLKFFITEIPKKKLVCHFGSKLA
jgi:hypothetical protein